MKLPYLTSVIERRRQIEKTLRERLNLPDGDLFIHRSFNPDGTERVHLYVGSDLAKDFTLPEWEEILTEALR
jgi:hypothetical protein